ncbi:RlmE family RNA methyltransferase [Candidatus Woesearchaeota archaeon]|jgi:23S rRNA (uridine2552-2'-O)-methyltransferase|nr:RlmE family RNA methyltransferase [Candidatus Woesearchaeota archaeon]
MGMRRDRFTRKAHFEGYLARSVYKLKDIQSKFNIIKSGDKVLDIGAAPGSWTQFAIELGAEVDAVDINKVKVGKWIEADITKDSLFEKISSDYDVVMSDLAPKTIGVPSMDNEISYDLSKRALDIASKILSGNGKFICKIFQSEFSPQFVKDVREVFKVVKVVKPVGSKKRSKEFYVVGMRKK